MNIFDFDFDILGGSCQNNCNCSRMFETEDSDGQSEKSGNK